MPVQFPESLDRAIYADYLRGDPVVEICERHGVSRCGVYSAVRRQGGSPRPQGAPTALTEANIALIVADRRAGASYVDLAAKYGLSVFQINSAIDRAILADFVAEMPIKKIRRRYQVSDGRIDRVRRDADKPKRKTTKFRGTWPDADELRALITRDAREAVCVNGFGASSLENF